MTFGTKLFEIRHRLGFKQDEMAAHLRTTQSTYSRWEREDTLPIMDIVIDIANRLQISLDELCDFKLIKRKGTDVDWAIDRLKQMQIVTNIDGDMATIEVSGVKYVVKTSDLPKLIEISDAHFEKMISSLRNSLYQSSLITAFGCGIVGFNQQYSNGIIDEILNDVVMWSDNNKEVRFTSDVLEDIAKDYLPGLPFSVINDVWDETVERLVISGWIDADEVTDENNLWKCPDFRKKRKSKKKKE